MRLAAALAGACLSGAALAQQQELKFDVGQFEKKPVELGGYVEFFSETSSRGGPWVGTVDVGLTYGMTEDIQLDAGVNVGVTRAAEDVNPFVGLSVRF